MNIDFSETKPHFKMPKKANIFESFSHSAIQQFKEAFGIMDTDKDGLLSSSDLVSAFAAHGKNVGGGEAQVKICWQGPKNVKTYINVREREGDGAFFCDRNGHCQHIPRHAGWLRMYGNL